MGQPARKLTAKDANEKLAHRRLTVLELAERLGNVAEACRRGGIDRTSFYDWKRRFQLEGLDGLKDLPPIAKIHPMTTPPEVVARIAALALLHPAYGCNRLEALLALGGRRLSAITIQKILNDKGLGTRQERWLALEHKNAEQAIELSPEQAAFLEKLNPCFKERHVGSERLGQLLSADTFMVGTLKGIGRVYLHAVVDTFGSYAFGFLHVSKQPEAAVALLHNDVLPFYAGLDLPIGAVRLATATAPTDHRPPCPCCGGRRGASVGDLPAAQDPAGLDTEDQGPLAHPAGVRGERPAPVLRAVPALPRASDTGAREPPLARGPAARGRVRLRALRRPDRRAAQDLDVGARRVAADSARRWPHRRLPPLQPL